MIHFFVIFVFFAFVCQIFYFKKQIIYKLFSFMANFASSKNLNVSSFFIIVLVSLVWDGRRRSSVHQTFYNVYNTNNEAD